MKWPLVSRRAFEMLETRNEELRAELAELKAEHKKCGDQKTPETVQGNPLMDPPKDKEPALPVRQHIAALEKENLRAFSQAIGKVTAISSVRSEDKAI